MRQIFYDIREKDNESFLDFETKRFSRRFIGNNRGSGHDISRRTVDAECRGECNRFIRD